MKVYAQCFSMWVTWCRSESSQPFSSTPIPASPSTSCSRFSFMRSRAPDLSHQVSLLCLCARLFQRQNSFRKTKSHPLYPLPLTVQDSTKRSACSMFVLLEFTSDMLSWGIAELEGPHTGVSQVRCRLWGVESCKRTGREQGWVGSQVLQLVFFKVLDLKCPQKWSMKST